MKRETRKWRKGLAAAIGAVSILAMAGCVRQTDTPIVSEKSEKSQEGEEAWEEDSQQTTEEGQISEGETISIRDQAEAPDTYETYLESEDITIMAKARVEVPDRDRIPLADVEYTPYTGEEMESIQELIGEELGIEEWVKRSESSPQLYDSSDGAYALAMGAGEDEETPMVWLTSSTLSDGNNAGDDADDLSGFSGGERGWTELEAGMVKKAERLLEKMGMEDFYLDKVRWRQLSVRGDYSWSLSGQYGVRLYYRRKIEDIPVVGGSRTQYAEFLYKEDGTLLSLKNIGRESIHVKTENAGFLLPFLSVSQVFEQCIKTPESDSDLGIGPSDDLDFIWEMGSLGENISILEPSSPGTPHIYLTVTDVKLAYKTEYEDGNKGKLVPVWAFYGTVERGYKNQDGSEAEGFRSPLSSETETLFLMVGVEDGTIYSPKP